DNILQDPKYLYLYSVEVVNNLVLKGMPFREAYKEVGKQIQDNNFKAPADITHTHEGSIGNLSNEAIVLQMKEVLSGFMFDDVNKAIEKLLK
ncbi:MAG: argininosuccinate lyase, partial [Bacteroidota bacterium]|nr:argininosuccinate lyase [Bacteroidota bacterium]